MRLKRLLIGVVACVLSFSSVLYAKTDYVPQVEIVNSIEGLIEKYDFEDEITLEEYDISKSYTYEEVERELVDFENYLSNRQSVNEMYVDIDMDTISSDELRAPAYWVDRDFSTNVDYKYGNGVFMVKFSAYLEVDYNTASQKITDIKGIKAKQEGHAMNLDSYEQEDEGFKIAPGTSEVWADVRINSSMTILGQKVSDSSVYRIGAYIKN